MVRPDGLFALAYYLNLPLRQIIEHYSCHRLENAAIFAVKVILIFRRFAIVKDKCEIKKREIDFG